MNVGLKITRFVVSTLVLFGVVFSAGCQTFPLAVGIGTAAGETAAAVSVVELALTVATVGGVLTIAMPTDSGQPAQEIKVDEVAAAADLAAVEAEMVAAETAKVLEKEIFEVDSRATIKVDTVTCMTSIHLEVWEKNRWQTVFATMGRNDPANCSLPGQGFIDYLKEYVVRMFGEGPLAKALIEFVEEAVKAVSS
ncbi:MAG: hypothetical protein WC775_05635 [Patescibacteria group bacterium]|jgi:hypothetical protein